MHDDIWVEEDEPRRRPRSVAAILAIAAVPWLIVAAIVFLPDRDGTSGGTDAGDAGTGTAPGAAATTTEAAEADGAAAGPAGPAAPGDEREDPAALSGAPPPSHEPPVAEGSAAEDPGADRALAAAATVIARAWATGVDPHLDIAGVEAEPEPRFAEHVAVEAIDRSASGLAVVTLVAIVLEEADDTLIADLRRIAVPLALQEGVPHLAGTPWWLPPPEFRPADLLTEPADDPGLAMEASIALERAGYADVEVQTLHRTIGWPWVVRFTATAPGGERGDGQAWLRPVDSGFLVAGEPTDSAWSSGGRP